jgi:hypothetical protein
MELAYFLKKFQGLIFYFLWTYLVIIIIVLFIGIFTYHKTIEATWAAIKAKEVSNLEQASLDMDVSLYEMKKVLARMSTEGNILTLRRETLPLKGKAIIAMLELSRKLQQYDMSKLDIRDFYVYFGNLDAAVAPSFIITDMKNFSYGKLFHYETMEYENFREQVFSNDSFFIPETEIYLGKNYETFSLVTFVYNLPTGFYNTNNSAVLMLINPMKIVNDMSGGGGGGAFNNEQGRRRCS